MSDTALMITLQHQLDENRTLIFQTAVAADTPLSGINACLDSLASASNRMRARSFLPTTRIKLDTFKERLKQALDGILAAEEKVGGLKSQWASEDAAAGRRQSRYDTPARKQALTAAGAEVNRHRGDAILLQREIDELEAQLAQLEKQDASEG